MSQHDQQVVAIEVDKEPDVLKRITLMHNAFLRVITGGRLIRVLSADYEEGQMEAIVESPPSRPPALGRVSIHYKPLAI